MIKRSETKYFKIYFLIFRIIFFHGSILILANDTYCTQINIVCTAALINEQYEIRKQEYINVTEKIKQFGIMPYIVESCKHGPTFLDSVSDRVWYSQTNDYSLRNKGVNEAKALL